MVDQLRSHFGAEVTRAAREVGTEGKLGGQAVVPGVAGTWKDLTDNVNSMASNLTGQVLNIAEVTIAVANGDLSKKITADVRGEILELKEGYQYDGGSVAQLIWGGSDAGGAGSGHRREARRPGVRCGDVSGVWKDLTESVNSMASNLTGQVRNIAEVTIAVANGDLSKKITVDVHGEILQLKEDHQYDGGSAAQFRGGPVHALSTAATADPAPPSESSATSRSPRGSHPGCPHRSSVGGRHYAMDRDARRW